MSRLGRKKQPGSGHRRLSITATSKPVQHRGIRNIALVPSRIRVATTCRVHVYPHCGFARGRSSPPRQRHHNWCRAPHLLLLNPTVIRPPPDPASADAPAWQRHANFYVNREIGLFSTLWASAATFKQQDGLTARLYVVVKGIVSRFHGSLNWTSPRCPLSLDFLRRESELLDGRMDAKNWGRGLG